MLNKVEPSMVVYIPMGWIYDLSSLRGFVFSLSTYVYIYTHNVKYAGYKQNQQI